jgi:ubiquinone/menaquinone biosynthesis C-methylase UbiE
VQWQNAAVATSEHDALTRRSFEQQVSIFASRDSLFAKRAAEPLSWIEPLTDEMIVLDVACGAAHASEPIAPHVRQIVGVDLTPALLRLGAQRLRDAGIANVLLQEANAESLPFLDESFDLVFCRASLHHFEHPERAIAEMVRVCRVGGRVVLMDLIVPAAEVREQFDHVHRLLDPSHMRAYTEPELAELLPGGIDALVYADTTTMRFPIEGAIAEHSDRDALFAALHAEVQGDGPVSGLEPAEEDGKLTVTFMLCVVHAERV